MARDPYNPTATVEPTTQGTSYESIPTNPNEFGGAIAGAEGKLSGDLGQAGNEFFQNAIRIQDFNNTQAAREANNSFMRDLTTQYSQFSTLEGQAAADALPRFQQSVEDTIQKTAAGLQSPMAQNDFLNIARYTSSHMLMGAGVYAAQQQKKSWIETNNATVDNLAQFGVVNQNSPQQLAVGESNVISAVRDNAGHLGLSPDETTDAIARTLGQRYYKPIIESQASTNPALAAATFARVRDKLDATTQADLDRTLRVNGERAQVGAVAAASINNLPFDPTTGAWLNPATRAPITPQGGGAPVSLDTGTRMRAQVVHDEAVKLGASPDEAWGWAANAVHESGAVAAPTPGDGGISHGMFQLNKDQLAAYQAAHNGHLPEQDDIATQLAFARSRVAFPENTSGPGGYATAISLNFEVPKGGLNEAQSRAVTALQLASVGGAPSSAPGGEAPAPGTPGAPQAPTHTPLGYSIEGQQLAQAWSNAQRAFPTRPDLQLEAVRPVWEHIQQGNAIQQKYEMETAKAKQDAQEGAARDVTVSLLKDPLHFDLSTIRNNPALDSLQIRQLTDYATKEMQKAGLGNQAATYGADFADLYARATAPDGTPGKMTDPTEAWSHLASGGLTAQGYQQITGALSLRRTAAGEAETQEKKAFLDAAHLQISLHGFGQNGRDPVGEMKYAQFLIPALSAYDAGRAAGKTPQQLLDEKSPDYIGKIIPQYTRTAAQKFADWQAANVPPDVPAAAAVPGTEARPQFTPADIEAEMRRRKIGPFAPPTLVPTQ